MKEYEIGKYILDLEDRFLYYVQGSVSEEKYVGYAEALEAARRERDEDVESGREAELLKESTDIVGIYNNTNNYTNIQGGTGIFGSCDEQDFFWSCGVWKF